jgi:hypothetical protein
MQNRLFVVQTNAVPGKEAEFDDWYTNQHLSDVLAVPGFESAQRFEKSSVQRDAAATEYSYRHLALYELSGDPRTALDNLKAAVGGGLYMSPALHADRTMVVYDAVTDRVTR